MTVTAPGSLVLVSGASGYIAAHVCQQLLRRGFRARGTVRSAAKGEFLSQLFESEGLKGFEYCIVEDVEPEGAFDEAVKGCSAVLHTASPFHFNVANDPHTDLINPAVNGTVGMLKSVLKEPKIERVVITSSFAAVVYPTPDNPTYAFTEADWNENSIKLVETEGKNVDAFHAYRASKTLAEKAAWAFLEEHTVDGKAPFAISTINPPLVFGPIIHQCESAKSLNTSVGIFYNFLTGLKDDKDATAGGGSYVDVRDVAQLHIEALVHEEAANKRFNVAKSPFHYQPFLDVLHAPENAALLAHFPKAVRGVPGCPAPVSQSIDITRARTIFNWEPISMEKTIVDMTQSLADRQKEW